MKFGNIESKKNPLSRVFLLNKDQINQSISSLIHLLVQSWVQDAKSIELSVSFISLDSSLSALFFISLRKFKASFISSAVFKNLVASIISAILIILSNQVTFKNSIHPTNVNIAKVRKQAYKT